MEEKIYCSLVKKEDEKIEEFLERFFYPHSKRTYYMDGTIQCDWAKRRSLDDIYKLVTYYYPEATIEDTIIALNQVTRSKISDRGYESCFMGHYCPDIRAFVFAYMALGSDELIEDTVMSIRSYCSWQEHLETMKDEFKPTNSSVSRGELMEILRKNKNNESNM